MKRYVSAMAVAALVATGFFQSAERLLAAGPMVCGIDMRVLVISANGEEADLPGITTTLDYLGTPYSVYVASRTPGGLTADRLSNGCHANFQAVIVTTGTVDNAWSGVLTATELQALRTFESQFKVRQVVWYTFPNDFGLTYAGSAVNTIGHAPLTVSLTTAGAAVFPYINRGPQVVTVGKQTTTVGHAAKPLVVEQALAYLAQPEAGAATTPLIKDLAGNTLGTVTTTTDGREVLALTFDSNAYSLQTLLFGYGLVNWATRGTFIGERHVYVSPQVDDVFIDDDRWVNGTSCSLVGHDLDVNGTGPTVRMTGNDLIAIATWQYYRSLDPITADLRLTLAFNGWGTTGIYRKDTLTAAAKLVDPMFYWVSHTYDHPTLDGIGYAAAKAELTMNNDVTKKLKLANYSTTNLVTPNVSGLKDAAVMQAIVDAGVKYVVTDTSVGGQNNPSPNVGIYNWLQPKIFMIPRRPVNLFYNVATPADWASEYNCIYHSFFGRDLTYQQMLDFVSSQLLPYLLHGENDPWMFHQPNLVAYDGTHTLLTDLLDLTLDKYTGYFTLPIMSPSMDALGKIVEGRTRLQNAHITATLQPGVSITLTADADVTVPITGLALNGAEVYGGQPIASVGLKAGTTTVLTVPAGTPATHPPTAPVAGNPANGATGVSAPLTLTWSAAGATSYDVYFGSTNPPQAIETGQVTTSYAPTIATGTTYFWQIVARNSAGSTAGPVWSFTTVPTPVPPAVPGAPSPAPGAGGVAVSAALSWSAAGATSYDLKFGVTNPPPQVAAGQAASSYRPALSAGTTYFWQVVARNAAGVTAGPIWSFSTVAAPIAEVVLYARDIPAAALHGSWMAAAAAGSPNGIALGTADAGFAATDTPLASPTDYVDVSFAADAGTPYTLWLRLKAVANSKYNDSVWVQFSDALAAGAPVYPLNSSSGLLVNLATDATALSLNDWGWQNGAYWLAQPATVTFAAGGTHTMRIQVREDGVMLDQVVLSSARFLTVPPGPVGGDATIVSKP